MDPETPPEVRGRRTGVRGTSPGILAAMSVQPIVLLGDPRLRLKGQPVDSFGKYLHELLDDLTDTMRDAPGVGLAAPQLGEALQACVDRGRAAASTSWSTRGSSAPTATTATSRAASRSRATWPTSRAARRSGSSPRTATARRSRSPGSGLLGARPPARDRPPRRQALHRLPRVDGRAHPGRRSSDERRRGGPRGARALAAERGVDAGPSGARPGRTGAGSRTVFFGTGRLRRADPRRARARCRTSTSSASSPRRTGRPAGTARSDADAGRGARASRWASRS